MLHNECIQRTNLCVLLTDFAHVEEIKQQQPLLESILKKVQENQTPCSVIAIFTLQKKKTTTTQGL